MIALPSIPALLKRTKALAALDLILSPDWSGRYYSFNSKWAPGQQMASMRDGSGDEWWLVFVNSGWAALKGLAHESPAWNQKGEELSNAIQAVFPSSLEEFAKEAAFSWESTSFAYFLTPGSSWIRANDLTEFSYLDSGEASLLQLITGSPGDYAHFAGDYYEIEPPVELVEGIFNFASITQRTVEGINPETSFEEISDELFEEIAYPR